jgi:hypothetical protein
MADAYEHINRKGEVYRLQTKPGREGRLKYSFARKISGEPAAAIPDGYEAREDPLSAQVTLRKIKPSAIRPQEKFFLEKAIARQAQGVLFIVDVEARALVVYTSEMEVDGRLELLRSILPPNAMAAGRMRETILANAQYRKVMRFTLDDPDKRLFSLERWHFSGTIDGWIPLMRARRRPLAALADEYLKHLGRQSYFELM